MIGVFDSGIGGLRLLDKLRQRWPQEDFVYLADQAHVPYGSLDRDTLLDLLQLNLNWLEKQGADRIVVACNTASATGIARRYRGQAQIVEIISKTCEQIPASTEKILVLATPFTAQSHRYQQVLARQLLQAEVKEVGLSCLAFMIEHLCPKQEIETYLKGELNAYRNGFDLAVLACTHFPFARDQFAKVLGIPLIDSESIALEAPAQPGQGTLRIATTGSVELLTRQLRGLMNWNVPCEHIQIEV